jgi:hypothetical protein
LKPLFDVDSIPSSPSSYTCFFAKCVEEFWSMVISLSMWLQLELPYVVNCNTSKHSLNLPSFC